MYQCGISKVPAIAFNKCRYVIYGLTDIKQAVQEYDDYIRKMERQNENFAIFLLCSPLQERPSWHRRAVFPRLTLALKHLPAPIVSIGS